MPKLKSVEQIALKILRFTITQYSDMKMALLFPHWPNYKRILFLLLQNNAAMTIHETLVIYVSL